MMQELILLKDGAAAREFVAFLLLPSTLAVIAANGYGVPEAAAVATP